MDGVGAGCQAFHADQGGALGFGLQTGPAAGRRGGAGGELFAHQGQAEFDTGKRQADGVVSTCVDAGKGVDVAGSNAQHLGLGACAV